MNANERARISEGPSMNNLNHSHYEIALFPQWRVAFAI